MMSIMMVQKKNQNMMKKDDALPGAGGSSYEKQNSIYVNVMV